MAPVAIGAMAVIVGLKSVGSAEAQQSRPSVRRRTVAPAPPVVIEDVTVIDVADGRHLSHQTVVVVGTRIQGLGSVGAIRRPAGARVVSGRGKYLIPGLWDMHTHLWASPDVALPLLLAHGVTGVRNVGTPVPLDTMLQWRRDIMAGKRVGPRIITTGPSIHYGSSAEAARENTPEQYRHHLWVQTPEEARHVVDSLKAAGADFIKHRFSEVPPEVYFALLAEGRRVGIPIVGHLPERGITPAQASDSGQRSLEHMRETLPFCTEPDACARLAARLRRNGTWVTPTLTVVSALTGGDPEKNLTRLLADAGAPLLAGTDHCCVVEAPMRTVHDELQLLVEAGLAPLAALQAATLNPARYLGATDSLGRIAPGQVADLVLLDADPLEAIVNTTKIDAVVANGRLFTRRALDALLAEAESAEREQAAVHERANARRPHAEP